jgi:hypothetical protein
MGIRIDGAQEVGGGVIEVTSTLAQYTKIEGVMPVKLLTIRDNRVISEVLSEELKSALDANAKAPRGTGANCEITAEMVYSVKADDKAVNHVTAARWNAINKIGYLVVNGMELPIETGEAQDFYEIDPDSDSDPTRLVYVVQFAANGETHVLTSYGVTNLIRRVVSFGERIIG